jgi:guanine deaminase
MLLRGRLLNFNSAPAGPNDSDAYSYEEDGAILVLDGRIAAQGRYDDVIGQMPDHGARIVDHRPHLILPGFIDTHIHFPQAQVIASWADQLLDWLNDYTFPAEMRFADKAHGKRIALEFYDALVAHGTTTAVAYCSSHPASVDAYFEEAERRGMLMLGGKTMMDRNAPAALCDTAQSAYDDSKALLEKWHGRGRAHYAITPRFAITSTPAQLEAAGTLLKEYPDCHLQTHINENHNEIALTRELYPDAAHYLGVYESFGLLGPKTLLGHCIHMTGHEMQVMRETGSVAVFCPTSNLFLGSGLFDKAGLEGAGIRTAIATDVGGGTSYSMLRTLDASASTRSPVSTGRPAAMPRLCPSPTGSARSMSARTRISWCSTPGRPRPWPCAWRRPKPCRKNCSYCRRSATTGQWSRPMPRDSRKKPDGRKACRSPAGQTRTKGTDCLSQAPVSWMNRFERVVLESFGSVLWA